MGRNAYTFCDSIDGSPDCAVGKAKRISDSLQPGLFGSGGRLTTEKRITLKDEDTLL